MDALYLASHHLHVPRTTLNVVRGFLFQEPLTKMNWKIITVLRFIPTLDRKRQRILEAQRARRAQFRGRGIVRKVREYLPLIVPLLNGAILMADSLAMAILNRGLGYTRILQETERRVLRLKDYVATSILMLLTVGAFYLRFGLQRGML